jgi:hypothetical protein
MGFSVEGRLIVIVGHRVACGWRFCLVILVVAIVVAGGYNGAFII